MAYFGTIDITVLCLNYASLPPFPLHCLFVCPTFLQQACQKNWTRQLSNPAGLSEDGRWNLFFLLFWSFFLHSGCKTPTLALSSELGVIPSKPKGGGEDPLSGRSAREFTRERDDHKEAADPSSAPSGIYSPCHFVITPSHAAIPLPHLPIPALIHMQKASFCNSSFVFLGLTRLWGFP